MRGGPDCFLASPYDADNPDYLEPGYIIGAEEFLDTYNQTPVLPSQ